MPVVFGGMRQSFYTGVMRVLNVVVAILNTFCNVTLKLQDAQLKTCVH